jgi:hypothetical protein
MRLMGAGVRIIREDTRTRGLGSVHAVSRTTGQAGLGTVL